MPGEYQIGKIAGIRAIWTLSGSRQFPLSELHGYRRTILVGRKSASINTICASHSVTTEHSTSIGP
jgi:hypothetical protein